MRHCRLLFSVILCCGLAVGYGLLGCGDGEDGEDEKDGKDGKDPVCETVVREAGPIYDQPDAENTCPFVCQVESCSWNGEWWTTVPRSMSVCQCQCCE